VRRLGVAVVAAGVMFVVLAVAGVVGLAAQSQRPSRADAIGVLGLAPAKLPPAARAALPDLVGDLDSACPELPALWVIALVQARSGGGAASFAPQNLRAAVGDICPKLRRLSAALLRTGTPVAVLDALAGSARTAAAVRAHVAAYAVRSGQQRVAGTPPEPFAGPASGCAVPDPSGTGGCVTAATAWLLLQVPADVGTVRPRSVTCWDAHAWNPRSDHPKGRGCDYTIGRLGHRPGGADRARGWALAHWLRAYAGLLKVSYVIWQGRIWSQEHDAQSWRPYDGGGVYDPKDVTGGHFDHVHVSLSQ